MPTVKKLLDGGSPVNTSDDSPLTTAVAAKDIEMVKLLLSRGADPDSRNNWGCPALLCAVQLRQPTFAKLLVDKGAKEGRDDALRVAAYHGMSETLRLLIAHGADVNAKGVNGVTPLHNAAMKGKLEVARLLLEAGAKPQQADDQGQTPEAVARHRKHGDVADLIAGFKPANSSQRP